MKIVFLPMSAIALVLAGCAAGRPDMNRDLIQASRHGDVAKVKALIDRGADPNAVDPEGWTPYLAASAEGNWVVMRVLEDLGARTDPGF